MIPEGGISGILSASRNLFTGIKPVIFLLLGLMIAFIILEFLISLVFKRANEEGDVQRIEAKIIGARIGQEIKEIGFLAKRFGKKLPQGWKGKIKGRILEARFEELKKKFEITD